MTANDVRTKLKGVFGFPVTPFRKDLSLDLDGLARNVAEMVKHPFCALVAAGGTGELYSMTADEIVEGRSRHRPGDRRQDARRGGGPGTTRRSAQISRGASRRRAPMASWRCPPYYINAPEGGAVRLLRSDRAGERTSPLRV